MMRIESAHAEYFKEAVRQFIPDAELYLFGSRTRDDLKGGDIDILVIGLRELNDQEKRDIKIGFYKAFGERKIDIVSFEKNDPSPFKQIALIDAVTL